MVAMSDGRLNIRSVIIRPIAAVLSMDQLPAVLHGRAAELSAAARAFTF